MTMIATVPVDLGDRSYDIRIGQAWLAELARAAREQYPAHQHVIISDMKVSELWGVPLCEAIGTEHSEARLFAMEEGEEAKTLETFSRILDFLLEHKYDRQTVVHAAGGGVVGDVAGFAAASFLRGVPLVQWPTTLLAMVDSSVGGKTGVNHPQGKNLIGAFKQPGMVCIDLDFLGTLSIDEYRSGLAEVVKYGMIADGNLFDFIEENTARIMGREHEAVGRIITRSCEIKASVVMQDETEQGLRAILNFGHTFAHAVENLAEYGTVRHGEAVAMGMMAACRLGILAGMFTVNAAGRLELLLRSLGLPTRLPRFGVEEYLRVMHSDKKVKGGRMRFVVPRGVGDVVLKADIEESMVREALEESFEIKDDGAGN